MGHEENFAIMLKFTLFTCGANITAIAEKILMLFFGRSVLQLYLKVIFTSKTFSKTIEEKTPFIHIICTICNFVMMPKSVLYRQMMGTTNPANAAPGTIRFQYLVVHIF